MKLMNLLNRLRQDQRGASAVEYGLLIAGIAGLIVLVTFAFGEQISVLFSDTCDNIQAQRGNGSC